MALIIDTHLIVKELIDAGASEKQAEVIVKRFVARDEIESLNSQLATKSDIHKLETDISNVKFQLESDISEFKAEIKAEIKGINISINWLKTISIANLTIMCGGMLAVLLPYMAKFLVA
jgi:hypothetical protein